MITQALLMTFITFLTMGLSYLFHFFMTRSLEPVLYGELAVVLGVITILSIPTSSLQIILTREIAKFDKRGSQKGIIWLIKRYWKITLITSLVIATALFFSSSSISKAFGDSYLSFPLKIIAISVPFMFFLSILRAYYQGRERFGKLAGTLLAETVIKLIFGVVLVLIGFGLNGAVLSIVLPWFILSTFLLPFLIKKVKFSVKSGLKLKRSFIFIIITSALITVFLYLDLFFVRYYLGAEQAGYYNVALITSRVLLYSAGSVTTVFFPKSSKLSAEKEKEEIKELLKKSITLILPIFILFLLFPREILVLFYSQKYLPALTSFLILSIGMFMFATFNLLLGFFWSQKYEKIPLIFSGFGLVLDVVLLNYLVPLKGIEGAALSTTLSSLFFLFSCIFGIKKLLF